jgi:hypothetical protein
LEYSPWARLGKWIGSASAASNDLRIYAEDVLAQMALHGMLGYTGAPMPDDLKQLTIPNAFELVNRSSKQARHFFLALIEHSRFKALGLTPAASPAQLLRDGTGARSLRVSEGEYEITTLLSHFRKPGWPTGAGAFAAFYMPTGKAHPHLAAGAYSTGQVSSLQWWFALSWLSKTQRLELHLATVGFGPQRQCFGTRLPLVGGSGIRIDVIGKGVIQRRDPRRRRHCYCWFGTFGPCLRRADPVAAFVREQEPARRACNAVT